MPTNHFGASIVSIGDHLIVAGGCGDDLLNVVEVYNGHQWYIPLSSDSYEEGRVKTHIHRKDTSLSLK